mmetsp:Transcript_30056/g.53296  ORF Transcript_30056/g.53296 Transcript_30056/m.53296 type:complete len:269 (+) Transcript_30056:61-867(+)
MRPSAVSGPATEYLANLKSKLSAALSEQDRLVEDLSNQQQVLGRLQSKLKYKEKQLDENRTEAEAAKDTLQRAEFKLADTESEVIKKRQVLLELSQSLRDKEYDLDSKQQTIAEERHMLFSEQMRRSKHNEARETEIAELKNEVQRLKAEIRSLDSVLEAKYSERAQTFKNLEAAQTAYARSTELNADRLDNLELELEHVKESLRSKKHSLMLRRSEELDCVAEREQTSWHEEISFAIDEKPNLFDDLVKRMALLEEKLSKSLNKSVI